MDKLDLYCLGKLRSNPVSKPLTTNGERYLAIVNRLGQLPDEERAKTLKPAVFRQFTKEEFGFTMSNVARVVAVLRHREFEARLHFFTSTTYGQRYFDFSLMEHIIHLHLDHVRRSVALYVN